MSLIKTLFGVLGELSSNSRLIISKRFSLDFKGDRSSAKFKDSFESSFWARTVAKERRIWDQRDRALRRACWILAIAKSS